ncbi:hypothetical protein [Alicyclobacillus suci]|uniref:hypothetical protein n=1 Tax=Alicyclobacillus suci TaxID=2816080 RepID=UPI001A8DF1A8|nr:hypothetical protein [Alicyclobacillus suci]
MASFGTGTPTQYAGTYDTTTEGIDGGKDLYVISPSPALPAKDQGSTTDNSTTPPTTYYARADFYEDTDGELIGPGSAGSQPAYAFHFDITQDNQGNTVQSNNGYEDINASMIDDWVTQLDGYQGGYYTNPQNGQPNPNIQFAQEFDNYLESEEKANSADWATSGNGSNEFTTYDLDDLVAEAGGGSDGFAVSGTTEGPLFHWTYAPEIKSIIAPQKINPGGTVDFYNSAAIESYNTRFHWEYNEILNSNGQLVSTTFNYPGQISSNAIHLQPGDSSSPAMVEINGGNASPGNAAAVWNYWTDGTGETTWGATGGAQQDSFTAPSTDGTYYLVPFVADSSGRVTEGAEVPFTVGASSTTGITLSASNTSPTTGTPVTLTATVQSPPPSGGSVADIFCLGMKSF